MKNSALYNDFGIRVTSATIGSNRDYWVRYTGVKADFTENCDGRYVSN